MSLEWHPVRIEKSGWMGLLDNPLVPIQFHVAAGERLVERGLRPQCNHAVVFDDSLVQRPELL